MTTVSEIRAWFQRGIAENKTHMIIVCDTFDYEDYPVYVSEDEDVHEIKSEYDDKNMQRIMEVYNLKMDMEEQLSTDRNVNY